MSEDFIVISTIQSIILPLTEEGAKIILISVKYGISGGLKITLLSLNG
jgi:hypothetical protein